VQSIRSSEALKSRTEAYRQLLRDDKDKASQLKKQFAGFLPAALVNDRRARANVIALTGLVMVDFDHVPAERLDEVRRKINEDKHTVLSYVTLSGEGLRVLAKFTVPDAESPFDLKKSEGYYHQAFTAVNEHYAKLTGCEFDPACKDLSRLSFAAFDATAYYQPEAEAFAGKDLSATTDSERKKKKEEKRAKNKALHKISQAYAWRVKPSIANEGVEYEEGSRNNYVMRVGYQMNQYGFEMALVQEWAAKEFTDYADAAQVIKWCYEKTDEHGIWADRLEKKDEKDRMPQANRLKIHEFLQEKVEVRQNLVLGFTEMRWKNPTYLGIDSPHSKDRRLFTHEIAGMVKTLLLQMEAERGLDASKEKVYDVLESDMIEEYDPLMGYLQTLPPWNADTDPDYIGQLADTVELQDATEHEVDLWHRCLKKWLVSMLVGWTDDDVVNHTMLIFVGPQGTYKSTWMQHLMPPELRKKYFKIKQNSGDLNKDDVLAMSRFGLILHEELDAMGMKETNTMKSMTTATSSDERSPYARTPNHRINIASLCGTGNNEQFLSNDQGTRRMLVFRIRRIQSPYDHPFNYEGIYSQAFALMKDERFQAYFNKDEQTELELHNAQFETVNMEEEALSLWLRKPEPGEMALWMRPSEILEALAMRTHSFTRYNVNKIGSLMQKLGFERTYHTGKPGYRVIVREYAEAINRQKELGLKKVETEETAKDISEAPANVQEAYSRLLGEKDRDLFEDSNND
jgi:predicted P-loop ATPase